MSMYELCVLDCQSIQQYVFGSNKLRTNIGASENVAAIFENTFHKVLGENFQLDGWKSNPKIIQIFNDNDMQVDVGYIGGGNALLIFRKDGDAEPARNFIRKWSQQVLLDFPGIVPAAAIGDAFEKPDKDKISNEIIGNVFEKLVDNKSAAIPLTTLPRHGITAECKQTGLSADVLEKKSHDFISSASLAKMNAAQKVMDDEFDNPDKSKYYFSYSEEKLGQKDAHNHIAVIHIDGNSMGKQFQASSDLSERRKLSFAVDNKNSEAWEEVSHRIRKKMPDLILEGIVAPDKSDDGLDLLPLRKIIQNGDDLTFICNAQLAFWLTEIFLSKLAQKPLSIDGTILKDIEGKDVRLSACAGIAIVKTKFPFYRAYQLAEELCAEAKKKGRDKGESWLDFEIVYGGLTGGLDNIRKKKYAIGSATLLQRPWRVLDDKGIAGKAVDDFFSLKNAALDFLDEKNGDKQWPRSKRKELLQSLSKGHIASENYVTVLNARDLKLPNHFKLDGNAWETKEKKPIRTPYFDVLQALEFYPKLLLEDQA